MTGAVFGGLSGFLGAACKYRSVAASEESPRANVSTVAAPASNTPASAAAPVSSVTAASLTDGGSQPFSVKELAFGPSPWGGIEKASVLVPRAAGAAGAFPLLVALHGRGESLRGIEAGAHGWLHDYDLGRAFARLQSPPLVRDDFLGFVTNERLAALNHSLAEEPFRGLVVACPFVPDVLERGARSPLDESLPFASWTVDELLPKVRAETATTAEPAAIGIDGVSLGGRVALVTAFAHPDRFGAVGTLQAAIMPSEVPELARRASAARARNASLRLRLVTSEGDYFREAITALHDRLNEANLPHDYLVAKGPHDYVFNRGPGAIEMLLWHDRVLRGKTPV